MIYLIFILLVIILILWSIYLYLENDIFVENELKRINLLEEKIKKEKDSQEYFRRKTTPCNVINLENPRECFLGSNHRCKWSSQANRCNEID
jgi:hypothetical protein